MSAPVFRATGPLVAGTDTVLDGPEGRHAATVLRLAPGEEVELVDGDGTRALGAVTGTGSGSLTIALREVAREPEPALRLVVAQALLKGDHWELAIDQLTQAGADTIVPWLAERSIVARSAIDRVTAKAALRIAAAAKQSRRARWPELAEPATTEQLASRGPSCIVLHEGAQASLGDVALPAEGELLLVIGPEGGIAPGEREALGAAGAVEARLGPTVLRGSLAGAVAAGIVLARTRWAVTRPGAPT